jgi:hypothetical protein
MDFAMEILQRHEELPKAIVISVSDGDCLRAGEIKPEVLQKMKEVSEKFGVPIFFGAPFGHRNKYNNSQPLPLHTPSAISINEEGKFILQVAPERTAGDIANVMDICQRRDPYIPVILPLNPEPKTVTNTIDLIHVNAGDAAIRSVETRMAFVFGEQIKSVARYEAVNLDGINLSEKNVAIKMGGLDSFDNWKTDEYQTYTKTDKNTGESTNKTHIHKDERTPERYSQYVEKEFPHMIQWVTEGLLELKKTGQLESAKSISLMIKGDIPDQFYDWLNDFMETNKMTQPVYVGKFDEQMKQDLFPNRPSGPPPISAEPALQVSGRVSIRPLSARAQQEEVGKWTKRIRAEKEVGGNSNHENQ